MATRRDWVQRFVAIGLMLVATSLLGGCGWWDLFSADQPDSSPKQYTIGGNVNGLVAGSSVVLLDDYGDALTVTTNGGFTFATSLRNGRGYVITVATQPLGETCTVASGTGTINAANVTNAVVTCSPLTYTLGGSISGLGTNSGLVLANGSNTLSVIAGATSFTMPRPVAYTSPYAVTVAMQPAGLACIVNNGAGIMPAHNVTTVSVNCTNQPFTVGGTISGLGNNSGLVLANGSDTLSVAANATSFTMPIAVSVGSTYNVVVQTSPAGLICAVSNGSGNMPAHNVTNVAVTCSNQAYTVGGTVAGLTASGLVLANGSDTLSVAANATSFTMPNLVPFGSTYSIVIQAAPNNLQCSIANGSGTMGAAPVTNVAVSCVPTFAIGGSISGLGNSTQLVLKNGADVLQVPANATAFTMPTRLISGASYHVVVQAYPFLAKCTVTNGSGTVASADVNNISVNCVPGTESVLYSFQGSPGDGAFPDDGNHVIQGSDGSLYGMTYSGGANGAGTVFKVTTAGIETVLWSFGSGTDGQNPYGSLIEGADGNFYGTTYFGGTNNRGTAFMITPAGVETVLWSFGSGSDGANPYGGLVQATDGNFYGMTNAGGTNNLGTVYKLTSTGTEHVLWSFGGVGDGTYPYGDLIQATDGNLYGTTGSGGANGLGAVFKITLGGVETVLYSFANIPDAQNPYGALVEGTDGNFYGSTNLGGTNNVGAVFKVTPAGVETVLWSFGNGTDGQYPFDSALVQGTDGNLYGLASGGGTNAAGVVFRVTLTGAESVLWSFGSGADGQIPYGCLVIGNNGYLYGLTNSGGSSGNGVVFQID